jgi:hypothetical protein
MRIGRSVRGGESAFQAVAQVLVCASPSAHPVGDETMRTTFTTTTLLAMLASSACIAGTSATALADTGGVASAPAKSPAPLRAVAHKAVLATWFGPGF